ncbi:thiopeptide-type bacteriocin biosynthesis protein [Streptomyces angustmyceticus]|uniref:thiopeptide-type bacteriocin biosynthesis protein n=1 Tax=Streptomyces angustmyceticus TaxID=285578 RepID=UPI0037F8061B
MLPSRRPGRPRCASCRLAPGEHPVCRLPGRGARLPRLPHARPAHRAHRRVVVHTEVPALAAACLRQPGGERGGRHRAPHRRARRLRLLGGVATDWQPLPYEPEAVAFGGPTGMALAHELFHTDSVGVLEYLRLAADGSDKMLDANATSLLAMTLMMRAAGLEFGEQGDVWGQVEARRPLADDVTPDQVSGMVGTMRHLLLIEAGPLLTDGPLAPVHAWIEGLEHSGRALAEAASDGRLTLGVRGILARHVLFHWNRMGFTTRQQSIWARAAREAALGR